MTITTPPTPLSYPGDGNQTQFPISWKYFDKTHVTALLRDATNGETIWSLGSDFLLTTAGLDSGGTLTATIAPASGETLVIDIDVPQTQVSPLPLGGDFPSTTVETMVDLTVQRTSKLETTFDRTFLVPNTDARKGSDLLLPIDADRASNFLAFDAEGRPVAAAGTSADLGPVSAYINTLLDDADAATARATLEAQEDVINTQGDISIGDVSGAAARLAIGPNGAVLASNGTTASWQTALQLGVLQIGQYRWIAHNNIPSGWLLCDARPVSRTTYAALFTEIGTTYGIGDGSTTFNLPDGRERSLIGVGTGDAPGASGITLGQKAGERTHTQTGAEVGVHNHDLGLGAQDAGAGPPYTSVTGPTGPGSTNTANNQASATAMQWLHPVLGGNLIIFAGA